MTPNEKHETLGHPPMTRYSPNGVDIIEECETCGARFLHNPAIGYPVSMRPTKEWHQRDALRHRIGLVYWLDRNGNGWGKVRVIEVIPDTTLVRVEDDQLGERYPVNPKDLKPEYALTRKQRTACGIA